MCTRISKPLLIDSGQPAAVFSRPAHGVGCDGHPQGAPAKVCVGKVVPPASCSPSSGHCAAQDEEKVGGGWGASGAVRFAGPAGAGHASGSGAQTCFLQATPRRRPQSGPPPSFCFFLSPLPCLALAFLTRLGPHQQQGEGGTGRSSALPSPGWECGTLLLASAVAPPSRLCSLARTFRSGGKKEERRRKGRWLAAPTCPARLPDGSSRLVTGGGGGGMGAHVAAAAALFGPRRRPQQTSPQASGSGIGRRGVARPVPSRRGALSQGRTKPCSSPLPLGAAGWRLAPPPPRAAHRGSSSSRKTKEPRPSGAPSAA